MQLLQLVLTPTDRQARKPQDRVCLVFAWRRRLLEQGDTFQLWLAMWWPGLLRTGVSLTCARQRPCFNKKGSHSHSRFRLLPKSTKQTSVRFADLAILSGTGQACGMRVAEAGQGTGHVVLGSDGGLVRG
jgi:hypothetical protein